MPKEGDMWKWLRGSFEPLFAADEGASGGSGGGGDGGADGDGESGGEDGDGSSNKDSTSYPDFHRQFPEEFRGHDKLKGDDGKWLGQGQIVREFVEDFATKRDRLVEVPGEAATPEERQQFYNRLGRPDSPAGYNLAKPDDWPSTVPWSAEGAQKFAERAFKAGLSKEMAEAQFNEYAGDLRKGYITELRAGDDRQIEWDTQIRDTYKDGTDKALVTADRAMNLLGDPSVASALKEAHLDRHPGIVRMLNNAWNTIGEDKIFSGAVDQAGPGTNRKARLRARYPATNFAGSGEK
jgi:hypothetical protein